MPMIRAPGTGIPIDDGEGDAPSINGRVIAIGISGASAISPMGTFLSGGIIHDNLVLAPFTQTSRLLDPSGILIGSSSNFGAPKVNSDHAVGAFLSIDAGAADTLAAPASFARWGSQVAALGEAIQMYRAQSPMWRKGFHNTALYGGEWLLRWVPVGLWHASHLDTASPTARARPRTLGACTPPSPPPNMLRTGLFSRVHFWLGAHKEAGRDDRASGEENSECVDRQRNRWVNKLASCLYDERLVLDRRLLDDRIHVWNL